MDLNQKRVRRYIIDLLFTGITYNGQNIKLQVYDKYSNEFYLKF